MGAASTGAFVTGRPYLRYNQTCMTATALHDTLASASAHLSEYSGAATAANFGDVRGEFQALVADAGVYDLGWRAKISVSGGDRTRWLNGMITNNVRDLGEGQGLYAFLLNPQGRILADLYAYNRGSSLVVDTDQSQVGKVLEIFDHYIIMDDVEVAINEKLTAIGLAGPKAREVFRSAGVETPELEPLQYHDSTWRNIQLTIVRGDTPTVESYELWLAPADVKSVWDTLVKTGAKPVGTAALELLRIASGIPRYGQDIREKDLPQETGQQRALHFTKGCYIGQEIVERIRSRANVHRSFTGFEIRGPLPELGTKIQAAGKDVGEITSAASLPVVGGEYSVALGYLRREAALPGKQLKAGGATAIVANVPFAEVFKH
jgi:folate-binding protein YgfZ